MKKGIDILYGTKGGSVASRVAEVRSLIIPTYTSTQKQALAEFSWTGSYGSNATKNGTVNLLTLASAGTVNDTGADLNALNIIMTDTFTKVADVNAVNIDMSGVTLTSSNNVYGIKVTTKTGVDGAFYGVDGATNIVYLCDNVCGVYASASGGNITRLAYGTTGVDISGTVVTGIAIGASTTGISLTGARTTGISMAGALAYIPLQVGTKESTSGSGVKLTGVTDNSGGVQLYFDDGGVSVAGEVVTPIRSRMLITVNQTSGTSVCGSFSQLVTLGTTGATKALTTGALRAAYIFNQVGALTMTSAAEVAGINQATTVAGNTTVDTTSTFVGVDINIRGAGTVTPAGNGVVSGLYIRSSETAQWTTGIKIKDAAAPTAIAIGTCTTAIDITGSASVTNLFKFASIAGCVLGVDVNPKDVPSGGGLGADACIRVAIGAADYFIPLFAVELS